MYKSSNKPNAIHFLAHILCKNANAISELAVKRRPQHHDYQRTSKSFAVPPYNRPVTAKHMLFCQNISDLLTTNIT